MDTQGRHRQAKDFLENSENDKAIELLRSEGAPNDAATCALLARAYFQRGDAKGDIYSAHFFASRAMELGICSDYLSAIDAICCYRKEMYAEANARFARIVTAGSNPHLKFLFGASLKAAGCDAEGDELINEAVESDKSLAELEEQAGALRKEPGEVRTPATGNMYESVIESFRDSSRKQIDAPYEHQPLSVHRGCGDAARDFDWIEKNVPCQAACPAGTNIPEYLNAIYNGEYDRAYEINLRDNVFPGVLGRVCARPCEDKCRHGWEELGEPVQICRSKRAAADYRKQSLVKLEPLFEKSGKKVAVVGGGVAGLTAARQLALFGHEVTVFEKHTRMGGMMNQGIPEFRLPRGVIDAEISQIEALGIELKCGVEAGRDFTVTGLLEENDAVILACGTLRPNIPDVAGSDARGIMHGLEFLMDVNEKGKRPVSGKVVVIGGGFTAMDCARTAWRVGAESVKVFYRRSVNEMLITKGELEELEFEGIPMEFMVVTKEYLKNEQGGLRAIRFIRTELGEKDESGRRRPVEIPGSEFEIEADYVLLATGQFAETALLDAELQEKLVDDRGYLKEWGRHGTAVDGLFLAGDFSQGASSLISAIGHAKQTALDVDQYLTGEQRVKPVVRVEDADKTGRIREMDEVPPVGMPMAPGDERTLQLEVEKGFCRSGATDETQRCYLCHYKFEIDHDRCIYCDWCIRAKPRPRCILKVSELIKDAEGRTLDYRIAEGSEDTKFIYINQEDCIRCGACVNACPVGCISVQKVCRSMQCAE